MRYPNTDGNMSAKQSLNHRIVFLCFQVQLEKEKGSEFSELHETSHLLLLLLVIATWWARRVWKLSIVKAEHETMLVIKAKPLPEDLLEYQIQSPQIGTCWHLLPSWAFLLHLEVNDGVSTSKLPPTQRPGYPNPDWALQMQSPPARAPAQQSPDMVLTHLQGQQHAPDQG